MSRERRFLQADVFSPVPTRGNALAVVVDGEGVSDEDMRAFAAWTNLAETTFLLPPEHPDADYKVRILTPSREMPFAGHPTLGSCIAWLHAGGKPKEAGTVRQECGVGIVEIDMRGDRPAFIAPPTRIAPLPDADLTRIVDATGIDRAAVRQTALLDNGPVWHALQLASAEQVLAADSSRVRWPDDTCIGLIGPHAAGADSDFEVRMLAPSSGMSEDPITGSLNAALAHWKQSLGELEQPVVIAQGTVIGRVGRVHVVPDVVVAGRVRIGGDVHVVIDGCVQL